MRKKLLILVPLALIVITVAGNWYYGVNTAEKIDKAIQLSIKNGQVPYEINYDKISVNPIFSKITFHKVQFSEKEYNLLADELSIKIKLSEAMDIIETKKLEELTGFDIVVHDFVLKNDEEKNLAEISSAKIYFNGDIKSLSLKSLEESLPQNAQKAKLHLSDITFHPENFNVKSSKNIPSEYNVINDIELNIEFDPDKKEIVLNDILLDSEYMKSVGAVNIEYSGSSKEDFKAKKIVIDSEMNSKGSIEYQQPEQGKFHLKNMEHKMFAQLYFNENGEISKDEVPEFKIHFQLDDLKMDYKEDIKQLINSQGKMIGIKADDLSVKTFSLNAELQDGKLKIEDTKLLLPVFDVSLNADVDVSCLNIDKSVINLMNLRISEIKPEVKEKLKNIEALIGFKIPMEGEDVLLSAKGTLKDPKIKGIHY